MPAHPGTDSRSLLLSESASPVTQAPAPAACRAPRKQPALRERKPRASPAARGLLSESASPATRAPGFSACAKPDVSVASTLRQQPNIMTKSYHISNTPTSIDRWRSPTPGPKSSTQQPHQESQGQLPLPPVLAQALADFLSFLSHRSLGPITRHTTTFHGVTAFLLYIEIQPSFWLQRTLAALGS